MVLYVNIMVLLKTLKKFDWLLISAALGLALFGILEIASICQRSGNFFDLEKQIVFLLAGVGLAVVVSFFDYRVLRADSRLIFAFYLISVLLLAGLLWVKPIRGIRGWYKIGIFSFDPVFISALVLCLVLAKYFSKYHVEMYRIRHIFFSLLWAFLPAFLIFLQPDLGSSLILIAVWGGIVLFSGIKIRHFLLLILLALVLVVFSWSFVLHSYQKQRIIAFLNPNVDKQGISWNVNQSKIAIGSGGIFGKGFGKGSQVQYGFLPEPKTDFIFSSIAEETGFLGVAVLFLLFSIFLWRVIRIAFRAPDNFARLFSLGFAFLCLFGAAVNIGMSLGILPIVGIPLPLVSYGGSQILAFWLGIGILMSIKLHQSLAPETTK